MKRCILMGAGPRYGHRPSPRPGDFVVAVDGGYAHLAALGICPDAVVGDFDSLAARPDHPRVLALPVQKDDTDMLAALRLGLSEGCAVFEIYGGTGGRIDHTLANIQCLAFLARSGVRGFLYGQACVMTCLHGGHLDFEAGRTGTVSVFALGGPARGVCIEGLEYPLNSATLSPEFPIGVSNALTGRPGRVSVAEGSILVIFPHDKRRRYP